MPWYTKFLSKPLPSFDELREAIHQDARKLSKQDARRRFAEHPFWSLPEAPPFRDRILALMESPDPAVQQRWQEALVEAIEATGYRVRPGSVEDIWYLEGLLLRLQGA